MFDFFNTDNQYLDPAQWLNNKALGAVGFALEVVESTGEILKKKRVADCKGLTFKLIPLVNADGYRPILAGSLHKFWNGGESNANRFTLANVRGAVARLETDFSIIPESAKLHYLEIGLNIWLPYSPANVLKSLVVYRGKPYVPMNEKPRLGRVCVMDEYKIKFYDKGFAEKNYDANILRVEVHFNKMRALEKYGLNYLSDLCDPAKVTPILKTLLEVVEGSIFIPVDADLQALTEREQKNFHALRLADNWQAMSKKQRFDSRIAIDRILKKCKAFDYRFTLLKLVADEWKKCLNVPFEAVKNVTFSPLEKEIEANENVTFSPFKYKAETLLSCPENPIENFIESAPMLPTQKRYCISCGKGIDNQRAKSVFCSEKYNGRDAKKCRNKDSNKRRDFKRIIMKAQKLNQWLRVHYRNLDEPEQTYSDILHSTEIAVNRGWLNTIIKIDILPDAPAPALYGDPHNEHFETIEGEPAKEYLDNLTAENLKNRVLENRLGGVNATKQA